MSGIDPAILWFHPEDLGTLGEDASNLRDPDLLPGDSTPFNGSSLLFHDSTFDTGYPMPIPAFPTILSPSIAFASGSPFDTPPFPAPTDGPGLLTGFPWHTSLDKTLTSQESFDHLPPVLPSPSTPIKATRTSNFRPSPMAIDNQHPDAREALRARLAGMQLKEEPNLPQYISPKYLTQSTGLTTPPKSERPLKRRLFPEELFTSRSAPVSPLANRTRPLAPLPRRAAKPTPSVAEAGKLSPLQTPLSPTQLLTPGPSRPHSASSSYTPSTSPRLKSEGGCDADDEYSPSSEGRTKKYQKVFRRTFKASTAHTADLDGQTQLTRVLASLPPHLQHIEEKGGLFYCPFENCDRTSHSSGDMGRHLESNVHATHKFVCLDPNCLTQFAREDSMKRHHSNPRGKQHKSTHDRMLKQGFECRVRREQIEEVSKQIKQLAHSPCAV
ncbi:hypothetical protein FA13DRAFT_1454678 [Coprinellus micaceus]|uniref:C2H2-type domain-containing protein n=1 Tax=Coprinellus micaceus TaxID=71717 RepID=A0A4Y7SNC1_COPMI|nr:hypothetical protein FA13DRAFT_1454678 [Coprinellus micaceus]